MKLITVAFILIIYIAKASSGTPKRANLKSIPVVDALIQRLKSEEWADDEKACLKSTLRILYGVKNDTLWATWVWDAMQPPFGVFYGNGLHSGNFDQCLKTSWSSQHELSTQYCLVKVKGQQAKEAREFGAYDSADEYLNTVSKFGRTFNHLAMGVCMPTVCSPSSIAKYLHHMLKLTHIPHLESINVDPNECQTAEEKPYPQKFYIYLNIVKVLLVVVIISTIYSNYYDSGTSKIDAIAKSFSLTHNWNDLFKVNRNEIRVLSGMKVITAFLVIGTHQAFLLLPLPSLMINSVEVDVMFDNEIGQGLNHLDLIVDTFLALSGLLLIKGLLSGRQKNLFIVLLKRYFRLIGPYAAMTFYIICIARSTGNGPFWMNIDLEEEGVCEKLWWKNILMLTYDIKTMCFGVAWYVSCEYHLAILTVVLFWIYRRSERAGLVAFVAVSFTLTAQLVVNAYNKKLQLTPFSNINEIGNMRDLKIMNDLYIRWHDRAGSYLVGVAMGWLMTVYKPADHRNVFSKTTSFIIVLVSVFVMLKANSINYWLGGSGRILVALAIATNRAVWAMAVCAIIAACEYGSIAFVSDFLGSAVFVPISKLCYGIYMTHYFVLQRNLHTTRSPLRFDQFNLILSVTGTFALACAAGLALYLLVEAPCINISNLYLSERKEKAELNSENPINGSSEMNGTTKVKTS